MSPRVLKGAPLHSLRKKIPHHTTPQNTERPGSPHSKKRAPPPAPHQRKSSAAPPQSTAVFHFGSSRAPTRSASTRSEISVFKSHIRARLRTSSRKKLAALQGHHFTACGKNTTPRHTTPHPKIQGGQVHPIARSVLHRRPHINANRQRLHPKVLPCSVLGAAVPQPDPPAHEARSRFSNLISGHDSEPARGRNSPFCKGTTSQLAEKTHATSHHTTPQNTGRPGSPHSKKPAPPPAPHQRKSSAAPPQSTAVFHFGSSRAPTQSPSTRSEIPAYSNLISGHDSEPAAEETRRFARARLHSLRKNSIL